VDQKDVAKSEGCKKAEGFCHTFLPKRAVVKSGDLKKMEYTTSEGQLYD
jgi:hypothetical protein